MAVDPQLTIPFCEERYRPEDILENVEALIEMYHAGQLGGEKMPEDARPDVLEPGSQNNFHFLTLPMALNYQRNSYRLWECAAEAYLDPNTFDVFHPNSVVNMQESVIREMLCKHKVALQPRKHTDTWRRISEAIVRNYDGDIRNLFAYCEYDVVEIRDEIQHRRKKSFPYLSGPKIFNYWLHVVEQYTPIILANRAEITVAPDTHIIQSSIRLGLIDGEFDKLAQNRTQVSDRWRHILLSSRIAPIDIHTPLWLWSRMGFPLIDRAKGANK